MSHAELDEAEELDAGDPVDDDVQITGKPAVIRTLLKSIEAFPPVPADAQV